MKKTILVTSLALVTLGGTAFALQHTVIRTDGYFNRDAANYPSSQLFAGEFTISETPLDTAAYAPITQVAAGTFQTFCLEKFDAFQNPSMFNLPLGLDAIGGGANNGPEVGSDPISKGTAWLYAKFASGTAAALGYDYTPGNPDALAQNREISGGLMQEAIWALEDEVSAPAANPFYDAALTQFGGLAGAQANADETHRVYVINHLDENGGQVKQDMLYYVPDGGTSVMLLGLALCGIGSFRRIVRLG